jgi:hypothetical protein
MKTNPISKSFWKNFSLLGLALPLVLGLSSCSKDDDDMAAPTPTFGKVAVTHASPDAPGVDLLIDNTKLNSAPVEFKASTPYITLLSGSRNIKVNVAGTSTTVINADLNVMSGKNYSVFAVDAVANIGALVIEDNLATPASGKAHVRFIHLSPDAPAVDVALDGGAVVFGDYEFKEYSAFTPLDAGTYDLEVRVAGTTTVALDLDPITVQSGKIYTVYARGFLSGSGEQALGAQIVVNN